MGNCGTHSCLILFQLAPDMFTIDPFNLKRKHSYVSKTEFWVLVIFPNILNCLVMLINNESHHGLLACSLVYIKYAVSVCLE